MHRRIAGTIITQVHAKDEDVGLNALVKYRLKPDLFGNYKTFAINENNGFLSLKHTLDRDKQKLYEVSFCMSCDNTKQPIIRDFQQIRVEAYDQGIPKELSSDLDLIIYVHSVDSYEPSFLVQSISVNFTGSHRMKKEKKKLSYFF